jgi:hypothetical protein
MIKKFESFKEISNNDLELNDFEYCYSKIINLLNDSYPSPDHLTFKYLDDKFLDEDHTLVRPLNTVVAEITEEDKSNIIKLYKKIYDEYSLGDFPDLDDILILFEDILDLSPESWFSILLKEKQFLFVVDLATDVKYYPKDTDLKINYGLFNEVSSELNVFIQRVNQLGYNVETYLSSNYHSKVKVIISK